MEDRSSSLVHRWIDAYREGRDDDLVGLAHPEIVLHPRRGQGAHEYCGLDGVRRWLADVGAARPPLSVTAIEPLEEGRVVAETQIDDVDVTAVFDLRDDRVAAVSVHLSDRELLERLGVIRARSRPTPR